MFNKISQLLGGAAMMLMAAFPAGAEIVENYRCDFKKAIDNADPAFSVASSWGHVVDSYTNYTGAVFYQSYTQSAYSGHDGCGKIDIGSQLLNNTKSCNDMLVTPKVSGAVTIWGQSTLYSAAGSVRFYAMKLLDDGTYEQGPEYTGQSTSSLPGYSGNQWVEITFDPIAEDAEYPYIGIHGHNARISDFNAEKAEIEKRHRLSVTNIRANGPTSGIVCDENNMAAVSLDVTIMNIGDYSYDGTEENLSVSIMKGASGEPLKTFDIGAISEGASKTVTCELDPVAFSELGASVTFTARENLTGASRESAAVTIREYRPVVNFREDGAYTNVTAAYVLDFGKVSGPCSRKMTVNAQSGTAPAVVTAIDCPAGFSTDWELPVTLATTGSTPINISFDPDGMDAGACSGEISFTVAGGDAARLAVSAVVLDPALIYIPFSDNEVIPGEIANGSGNNAWKLGYSGSGSSRDNYLQPTSSYAAAELVLPKLTFSEGNLLTLDARRSGTGASLSFAYSPDRGDWTELPDATLTMNTDPGLEYDFKTFGVKGVPAGDYYLKITGSEVYIDNIYGLPYAPVTHDLSVSPLAFPAVAMVNNLYTASVSVRNYLPVAEEAGSYTVALVVGDEEYGLAGTPEIPGAQGTAEVAVSFTPHAAGTVSARIEVRFPDGYVLSTPETEIAVAEEKIDALHVVTPASNASGAQYVLPFNYSPKVLTEQIFPAEYVGLPAGAVINGVSFRGNTTRDYSTHIEAWVALSDKTAQNGDKTPWYDVEDLEKVYDGDYHFAASTEKDWFLDLPFSREIVYDGESSVIIYLRAVSDNSTVYTFNFEAYNNGDNATRYLNYARWGIADDGSLTGWDNYYLGYAALNLAVEAGVVSGHVMEGELPVVGAAVTLRGDNVEYYGTSDEEGAYSIDVLQTGRAYAALAEADGFVGAEASVSFDDGMTRTLDLAMLPVKADLFQGVYEAVTLPDVSAAPAGIYYGFEAVDGNTLVFREVPTVSELRPDVPYILLPEADCAADLSALTFGHVAGTVTVGGTDFKGTYASRVLRDGELLPAGLIKTAGALSRAADTREIARAAGAYITTDILNPVISLRETVSAIGNVEAEAAAATGAVHTIDGRLVRADGSVDGLPAGIYLVNGRKVAVR